MNKIPCWKSSDFEPIWIELRAVFHQDERDPDQVASQTNIDFGGLHPALAEPLQVTLEAKVPGGTGCIKSQSPILTVALLGELALAGERSGITDPDIHARKGHERIGTLGALACRLRWAG